MNTYYLVDNHEWWLDKSHPPISKHTYKRSAIKAAQNMNARRIDVIEVKNGIPVLIVRYPLETSIVPKKKPASITIRRKTK